VKLRTRFHLNGIDSLFGAANMNGLGHSAGRVPQFGKKVFSPITGVFLTAAALLGAEILRLAAKKFGIPLLVTEPYDIRVYYNSSRWVVEGGRLYREVWSEYPLLANMIFASYRYLSNLLHPGFYGFYGLWVASAWFVYLWAVYRVAKDVGIFATIAWLSPGAIFFSLFRFDIYPAVATLMFLFSLRRTAYLQGAIWLGVAIALKGYALFILPAYCVFMVYQRGVIAAVKIGAVAIAPMVLSLLITVLFAGWEGVIVPFQVHAARTLNGESTYDAINYLFGAAVVSDGSAVRWIGQSLQVGCALAAAAMRPRSFDDLVSASLFSVLGFISFSSFYSPQYVLWILPIACFLGSQTMLICAILFSWLTYFYYPIGYYLRGAQPAIFKATVGAVSLLRLLMMFLAIEGRFRRRV
jgi:hypothetical protein